jgi:hypothetical protein
MNLYLHSLLLLLFLLGMALSRPAMRRIVINHHVWEVPNEPGWEEVIQEADLVHQLLRKCTTASQCRRIVNELRTIFYRYPVSRKYLESGASDDDDLFESIFKWG